MRILSLISERGQLDGLICIQRQSPGTAFLFGLRVRQESRNRGLASRLMQAAERHGRDAGAAALLSCTIMPEMVDTLFPRFGWSCVRRCGAPEPAHALRTQGVLYAVCSLCVLGCVLCLPSHGATLASPRPCRCAGSSCGPHTTPPFACTTSWQSC